VQALLVELDLMKKTDLFSRMMRSKMRSAVQDNGLDYLETGFERLKQRATPSSSGKREAPGSPR
jgi:hypothetical protein